MFPSIIFPPECQRKLRCNLDSINGCIAILCSLRRKEELVVDRYLYDRSMTLSHWTRLTELDLPQAAKEALRLNKQFECQTQVDMTVVSDSKLEEVAHDLKQSEVPGCEKEA